MQENAENILQEYADNRGVTLRVDRDKGIIAGVKLLGTVSKKGREYPRAVMAKALPMYEGMRVNVDHVDPGQRRSLRDRIGLVKNVTLKEDGLYGDFHYNPKHALAEQIAWDAENAPQNLGFSHDTRGGSKNVGGRIVVESIDKVLSVDLVANPATTTGLFEDEAGCPAPAQNQTDLLKPLSGRQDSINALSLPESDTETKESIDMDWKDIDLDGLRKNRPELLTALQEAMEKGDELTALREELNTLKAEKAARELRESITGELKAAGLDPADKTQVSEIFMEDLLAVTDAAKRTAKIVDRTALVSNLRPGGALAGSCGAPFSAVPFQEDLAGGPAVPPATAPLAERIARFAK